MAETFAREIPQDTEQLAAINGQKTLKQRLAAYGVVVQVAKKVQEHIEPGVREAIVYDHERNLLERHSRAVAAGRHDFQYSPTVERPQKPRSWLDKLLDW